MSSIERPTAPIAPAGPLRWTGGLVPVLVGWVWARCCIAAGWVLSDLLDRTLDNPRDVIGPHNGLFTWDGNFYRDLAVGWYDGVPEAGARFFPLYPALARGLAPVFGGREDVALIVLSNVTAFLGAWVLWRLVAEVIETSAAGRAAWMVSIAPAAFVLAWAYTEGLALLLVAATLLALHRRAFAWAGLFALLSAMLRPVGGLLLVPIVIEVVRARPRPRVLPAVVAVAAPVVGLVAALGIIAATTGDVWIPIEAQQELRGGFQDPITRVLEPMGEMVRGNFRDVYNLAHMLVLIALLWVAWRRRQPLSWLVYAALTLLITLSSQQTDSLGRYALVVVPFVVALAQWAEDRWRQAAVAMVSSVGLVWLTSEALLGRMVP